MINSFNVTCVRFRVHSFAAQLLLQQKYRSAIKITKWFIFMTFCTFYVNIFRIFYMPSDRCCAVQTVASYFISISYRLCYNMNPTKRPESLWRRKLSPENTNTIAHLICTSWELIWRCPGTSTLENLPCKIYPDFFRMLAWFFSDL